MLLKTSIFFLILIAFVKSSHQPKGLLCKLCESVQSKLSTLAKNKGAGITDFAVRLCQIGLSKDVCNYFGNSFSNDLFMNKPEYILETNYMCTHMFNFCDKTTESYNFDKFKDDFYSKYPIPESRKKGEGKPFKMLVLNDIHIQNDYAYKANADCGEVGGCCSNYYKPPRNKESEAGYWGTLDKNCDIPSYFFDNTIAYIKEKLDKPDFLVILGDNYGHNYFRTSEQDLLDVNKYIYENLKATFTNTIILPVLGNHECHPVDHLDLKDPDNFVYKHLYPIFGEFIGNEQVEKLKDRGYYSLSYPEYNIKMIHINTQLKDMFNTKLIVDNTNPLGFFDVIGDEFYESESKGEKVLILTHIPIGDIGSIDEFGKNFKVIIERFSDIIIGIFSGHTHNDSFIFVKNSSDDIVGINYVSPSITTFSGGNPSFRVYDFNSHNMSDYTQYIFDVDYHNNLADNGDFSFNFQPHYTLRASYELQSWGAIADYTELHSKIFDKEFFKRFYSFNFVPKVTSMEDHVPEATILCTTFDNLDDITKCQMQSVGIDFSLFIQQVFRYLFVEPWRSPVKKLI